MFQVVLYNVNNSRDFDSLDEAIKWGFKAGFEFYVYDRNTGNIVFQ